MKRSFGLFCLLAICLIIPNVLNAQVFENNTSNNNNNRRSQNTSSSINTQTNSGQSNNRWLANPRRTQAPKQTEADKNAIKNNQQKKQPDILDIPQTERPTLDGIVRGHVSMQPVMLEEGQDKEDRFIFFYYTDFGMRSTMSGKVLCDIRFVVLSTLDRKINNVSVRLKWPNMETPLSFSEVAPNVENFYNYTLVGDGCYTMDKAPNIVVNRCRVRNMSQKECAEKIRWLRKSR